MNMRRHFTEAEDVRIREEMAARGENPKTMVIRTLAVEFGRTQSSVANRISILEKAQTSGK